MVESHIATLLWRGAGQVRYKGLLGAVVQQGMTVMAHHGAVVVRIRPQQLSKRAQKFRRFLGLKTPKINQISGLKTSDHYIAAGQAEDRFQQTSVASVPSRAGA